MGLCAGTTVGAGSRDCRRGGAGRRDASGLRARRASTSSLRQWQAVRKTAEVSSPVVGTSPFQIGSEFHGVIDEVRVSQVARYQADFTPPDRFAPDADTLGLYHFDEAAGERAAGSSTHKHNGKITGATWMQADGVPIPPAADSNRP